MHAISVPYDELSAPSIAEEAKSDRSTIFPDVRGPLCASHPKMCQALAKDAVRSGAELVCGVAGVRVQTGKRPSITFHNGTSREVRPRLIIGADGRASTVRKQSASPSMRRQRPTWSLACWSRERRDGPTTSTPSALKGIFSSMCFRKEAVASASTRAMDASKRPGGPDVRGHGVSSRHSRASGRSRNHWA